jgi:hypothetical protein
MGRDGGFCRARLCKVPAVSTREITLLPAISKQYEWLLPGLPIICPDCGKKHQQTGAAKVCFADLQDAKP